MSNGHWQYSRRQFLRHALLCSGSALAYPAGLLSLISSSTTFANQANDYQALIYIFLAGGNDANNLLVPMGENPLTQRYQQHRGAVALPQAQLLPLSLVKPAQIFESDSHNEFGLHPNCGTIAQLFDQRELALVCNIGNLLMPTTRADYLNRAVALPPQLFSHADQQRQFQSEPKDPFQFGWGGRLAELLQVYNPDPAVSPLLSLSGLNTFQVSKHSDINPFVLTTTGIKDLNNVDAITDHMLTQFFYPPTSDQHLMAAKYQQTFQSMQRAKTVVDTAFDLAENNSVDYDGIFTAAGATSTLGEQLKAIAKFIAGRDSSSNKRPIFFVNMNGFDTHQNLLSDHAELMTTLNNALSALNTVLKAQSDFDKVLTFCGSEFGRTLTPNGNDAAAGTDHAWGGHGILMGGMVNGGNLFGTHPDLQVGQGLDTDSERGRWIPTTPTCHVNAHIAHWFGLQKSQLSTIFPSMANFDDPFKAVANLQLFKVKGQVL